MIPITDGQNEYVQNLAKKLLALNIRASVDVSSARMNAKIRSAQLFKIPYMLVIGEREMNEGKVSLRKRDGSRQDDLAMDAFIEMVQDKIKNRSREI